MNIRSEKSIDLEYSIQQITDHDFMYFVIYCKILFTN